MILNRSRTPRHSATDVLTEPEYETINIIHNRNTNISMTPNPAYDTSTAVSVTSNPAYCTSAVREGNDGGAYEALEKTDHI